MFNVLAKLKMKGLLEYVSLNNIDIISTKNQPTNGYHCIFKYNGKLLSMVYWQKYNQIEFWDYVSDDPDVFDYNKKNMKRIRSYIFEFFC